MRQCFSPTLNLLNGIKADARNDYRTIGNTNKALCQNYYYNNPDAPTYPWCNDMLDPGFSVWPQSCPQSRNNGWGDVMNQYMQTMLFMKMADNL